MYQWFLHIALCVQNRHYDHYILTNHQNIHVKRASREASCEIHLKFVLSEIHAKFFIFHLKYREMTSREIHVKVYMILTVLT